jgi:hypothetical protein
MQSGQVEINKQIEEFLLEAPLNYIKKAPQNNIDIIRDKLEKIIFSHQQDCLDSLDSLKDLELSIESLYFRLTLTGLRLLNTNVKPYKFDFNFLKNLSKCLVTNNIEPNLEHGLVYASLAYFLSKEISIYQTVNNLRSIKKIIQEKQKLLLDVLNPSFVKIYCALFSILNSWETKNNIVHCAYADLSWQDRIGNHAFEAGVLNYAIRSLNFLDNLSLSERIGVITAYSVISKNGYEESTICPINYLEKSLEFVTKKIKHELIKKDIVCANIKSAYSVEKQQNRLELDVVKGLCSSIIQKKFTQYKIKKAKEYIQYKQEELKEILKNIKTYYFVMEQQYVSYIHQQCMEIKKHLQTKSFGVMLTNVACRTISYVATNTVGDNIHQLVNGTEIQDIIKLMTSDIITDKVINRLQISPNTNNNNNVNYVDNDNRSCWMQQKILDSAVHLTINTIILGYSKLNMAHILTTRIGEAILYNVPDNLKFIAKYAIKLIEQGFLCKKQAINAIRQLIVEDAVFHVNLKLTAGFLKTLEDNYTNLQFNFKKHLFANFIVNANNMVIEQEPLNVNTKPEKSQDRCNQLKVDLFKKSIHTDQGCNLVYLEEDNRSNIIRKQHDLKVKKFSTNSSFKQRFTNFIDKYISSLNRKFVNSSWYDMPTILNITNTSSIEKDKTSKFNYKDVSTKKLDTLLSKKAKYVVSRRKTNIINTDSSFKFSSKKIYKILDFFRSKAQGEHFVIETGGRIFFGNHNSAGVSLFQPKLQQNVGYFIRKSAGINLASGKVYSDLASLRADVNSFSGGINLNFKANTGNKKTDLDVGVAFDTKLFDVKWELKLKKICFGNNNCYKLRLLQSLGIGYGFQYGLGYVTGKEQGLSSFHLTAGSNLGAAPIVFGNKITIEREPNQQECIVDKDSSGKDKRIKNLKKM